MLVAPSPTATFTLLRGTTIIPTHHRRCQGLKEIAFFRPNLIRRGVPMAVFPPFGDHNLLIWFAGGSKCFGDRPVFTFAETRA